MTLDIFQIDAFTDELFKGNPACVVPLKTWPDDSTLLNIAKENAVAETAFFIIQPSFIRLRWFTPEIEMDLCGHATLATAHVLKTILNFPDETIKFQTLSGELMVKMDGDLVILDFPSRKPAPAKLPDVITRALSIKPEAVLKARDYLLVYKTEDEVRNLRIDRNIFDTINLDPGGVIATSEGKTCDFVSRYFTPQASILEDPVTGSAHCTLIPYWSERLGKNELRAMQVSERSGNLQCEDKGDRVLIGGKCRTYLKGTITLI